MKKASVFRHCARIFWRAGLRFGVEMDIFHRHLYTAGNGEALFSMHNALRHV
jgi:FtsZ-interacting cell division protein ZipA